MGEKMSEEQRKALEAYAKAHQGGPRAGYESGEIPRPPEMIWDKPLDIHSFMHTAPPPIKWLIKERMQAGRGGLVSGIGGSSKTRFFYHLSIGAAIGYLPWEWEVETTGKSVLVLTEDTAEDAHRTIYQTAQGMGLDANQRELVGESVIIFALAGVDMKLLARDERKALQRTPHYEALRAKIEELQDVVFIGIDPALSVTEGDELDQNDQRALGRMADDLAVTSGATVLIATHSPKGSQQTEELTSHTSRGGGAITDAVRMEFVLRTMTLDEGRRAGITALDDRKAHVQLAPVKGNHLPSNAYVPVWLKRGAHGVLEAADVSFDDDAGGIGSLENEALGVLRDLTHIKSTTLTEWRRALEERGILAQEKENTRVTAMKRIKTRLLDAGMIERGVGNGVYVPVQN